MLHLREIPPGGDGGTGGIGGGVATAGGDGGEAAPGHEDTPQGSIPTVAQEY